MAPFGADLLAAGSAEAVRPLLVTADPDLLEELLRFCAQVGCEPAVADVPETAGALWRSARLVLIGADAASRLGPAPARRDGVVLVGRDSADAAVWRSAVALGAEQVLFLPEAESALMDLLADSRDFPSVAGVVVAVVGARGGAGATTAAVAIGTAAAAGGLRSLLVDADPFGSGVDLALGAEGTAGLRWPDFADVTPAASGAGLAAGLPRVGELALLSWDRGEITAIPHQTVSALLAAGRRSNDLVVVDMARTMDSNFDVTLEAATVTLLVVPAEVRACASAGRLTPALTARCPDVRVLVRGPAPGGLAPGLIADSMDLPLAGWVRAEPGLATGYERGEVPGRRPRSPLARFARDFVDAVVPPVGLVA
jgi:secretion/DNA translocation related CpaE-like protein